MRTRKCSHVRTVLLVLGGELQRASELTDTRGIERFLSGPVWFGLTATGLSVIEEEEAGLEPGFGR